MGFVPSLFTTLYATDTGFPPLHSPLTQPYAFASCSLTCLLALLIKPAPSLSCRECAAGFCGRGCYTNTDKRALPLFLFIVSIYIPVIFPITSSLFVKATVRKSV